MWIKLFRAEWHKIIGHRWITGCLLWVFPALAILVSVFAILATFFSDSFREGMVTDPAIWTEVAIIPWVIPNNPLGRALLMGFTAVWFAGEYQWNTWKSIVPRSQRIPLIIVKFITVAIFIVVTFNLMAIIMTLGFGIASTIADAPYGPPLEGDVLRTFGKDYTLQMLFAFVSTIIAAGYASLAAMITRSILGSVITSIILAVGETLLILPLILLANLFNNENILHIYRFIPSYNLINLFGWLIGETPEGIEIAGKQIIDSQLFNEVVLLGWVVGLIALTAYFFQRQDITN